MEEAFVIDSFISDFDFRKEGVEDAHRSSMMGDGGDDEGRRVMRSYPTPSTSLIVASCATLVLAATTTPRGGPAGSSSTFSLLDGARANSAGELGRERILTDIPFEDDHVKMVVPRIEREIAAEELGGEVSWVRSAWDGTISAL